MIRQFKNLNCLFFLLLIAINCNNKKNTVASKAFNTVYQEFDNFHYNDGILRKLDSVVALHPDIDFTSKFNYYNYKCGYYHINKKDDQLALRYADSLLYLVNTEKANPDNNQIKKASANIAKGDVLFSLGRYNNAYEFYFQGMTAAEKSTDAKMKSEYNYRLAMVMYKKEQYSQAAKHFIQAFQQSKQSNEKQSFSRFYREQELLNNVAFSYIQCRKPDSALLYSKAALEYVVKNENHYPESKQPIEVAKAVIYGTTGQAYLLQNNTTEGEKLLEKSIAINSKPGYDNGSALQMQLSLAHFYIDTISNNIQPNKAKPLLQAIRKELGTLHNDEAEADWTYLMSRYYDKTNNKPLALSYLKKFLVLNNDEILKNKALSEADINTYFQTMQDQLEVALLKKDNAMKRLYLTVAIILFMLCGSIVLLILHHLKNSKKHVQDLTTLNKKIRIQKKELKQTLKALDKRSQENDYILKIIAHDLRNPLSAVGTLAGIIKEEYRNETDNMEYLDMIQSASDESMELIDSIMQIEIFNNTQQLKKKTSDINKIVLSCVQQLKMQAAEKNQHLILNMPDLPQFVSVDSGKIHRVVNNLIINAIKFSHKNSDIEISVKQTENDVVVLVKDNGIGIPVQLNDKVFDVFTEAKRQGTENEKTFGLGLSICKQFIEAHGGKIWFNSQVNEGTSFYVQLHKEDASMAIANGEKAYTG